MMVILHVLIAVLSLAFTTFTYFKPTQTRLHAAYGLVGMTLATGIYLVWSAPSHMLEACMTGLVYLGMVSLGIVAARYKLARQVQEN